MRLKSVTTLAATAALLTMAAGASAETPPANPVPYPGWNPAGGAVAECALIGEFAYAGKYNVDGGEGAPAGSETFEFFDGDGILVHSNTITIFDVVEDEGGEQVSFSWSAEPNGIGAVIVKAGPGANVWFYDPQAKSDTGLYGFDNKNVSHITFCWNEDPPVLDECWEGETAWSDGGRYNTQRGGNWATYTAMNAGPTFDVPLFAGQTLEAGTVTFAAVGETVDITIVLNTGWRFAEVDENLKIQGYESAPSGNPSPGGFAHKFTVESPVTVNVPFANFYGVHADVEQSVECPDEEEGGE